MNILLTNDDGLSAQGLQVLNQILSAEYNTYIIAPDSEKSACSNAITTKNALKIKKEDERIFSVSGYPADCVNIGLHSGIIPEVDLVISGINHGPNVGNDVVFSGTVAGARTAYIFGKTGIAVSIDSYHKPSSYFKDASTFILNYIQNHRQLLFTKPQFLNINYPDISFDKIKGAIYTHLGNRIYRDAYQQEVLTDTEVEMRLDGDFIFEDNQGSDINMMKSGFISITPLIVNTSDVIFLHELAGRKVNVVK